VTGADVGVAAAAAITTNGETMLDFQCGGGGG